MLRPARLRVPAAAAAAGALLLSACAAAGPTVDRSGAGVPTSLRTSTAAATAAAPVPPPVAPGSASGAPGVPASTPAVPHATPTLVYEPTASTWAALVIGGTVTTTAAAPSVTPTALASVQAEAGRTAVRALQPVRPAADKTVYLTFDDGPSPAYSRQVLKLLDEYNAKATFFVIGRQVRGSGADIVRAEYTAGHGVGNHTWNHRSLRKAKKKVFDREVLRTQRAVKKATGHAPMCLRPPGGAVDKNTSKRAKQAGLKIALWTVDPDDWRNPKSAVIATRVIDRTHDGSIVLMHDGGGTRKHTVSALRTILKALDAKGYTFAALPHCR